MVTPTVRALELLEKLAEERSKLIEDKLIADQVIESMKKSRETSSESDNSILAEKNGNTPNQNSEKKKDENKKNDELQAFLERTIQQKNEENLKLAKTIAENKVTEGNRAHELQRQRQEWVCLLVLVRILLGFTAFICIIHIFCHISDAFVQ